MKKSLVFLTIMSMLILPFSFARASAPLCPTELLGMSSGLLVRHLPDGSRLIETVPVIVQRTEQTITSQKYSTFINNDGVIQWKVTLTASFTYNGSTATCTSASSVSTVYSGNWSENANNTFASGNAAVANVTMVRKILFIVVQTEIANLVITCDKDGNIT